MKVYRIAGKKFIHDMSGEGARLYGGRWNSKGTSVLYTSTNRSLATIEYLVHLPMAVIPADVCIAELSLPTEAGMDAVDINDLPSGWWEYPAPLELAETGDRFIRENSGLSLKVPSAIVKGEWNVLINPRHSLFSSIEIAEIEEYVFDSRLFKR